MADNRKTVKFVAAAGLLAAAAFTTGSDAGAEDQTEMNITYTVGHLVDGEYSELGTVVFDENNKGELLLNDSGPDHDRLAQAWAGIADLDVLHVRRSELGVDEDGDEVYELIGVDIERKSEEYPEAVFEYLSWKFGFFGEEVEPAD